ncbi:MAG: tRNA preQ1(34) S-adenosylmethionine ribosyltransferase-isomerase QueA [Bacillota bacterium]|jgi:S-adenosylmethionine:tRNA ribosyltransferase-isomerase|nr:tRNA preQ1(34) S-adenosylmethionine ribosyltransferase-isomerase QueA [Candidatus Fermentithermobacillaceae bacterium]
MKTEEFDYYLPEELIAQTPAENRDSSKLLVLDRKNRSLTHGIFSDILHYIDPGDALVINNTRVIKARLIGRRSTGGRVEVLLLNPAGSDTWECLVRPGHKLPPGEQIFVGDLVGQVQARTPYGGRLITWRYQGNWEDVLERVGRVPLPPYIKTPLEDPERYQTVYAQVPGSAAAPTAGLHFTPSLLDKLSSKGVELIPVTLNVGLGTFRPVTVEDIEDHEMHSESYEITEEAAEAVNKCKESGHRVFAVGTTVVRVLESSCHDGKVLPGKASTSLFIYPGYRFKVVDCMITNFHLPKSTLLMMVSAFAGKQFVMDAYQEAIKRRYRFFSFGDAMLIW